MSTMRTALDFPRNEAGLVDKFLGTAFDAVYTIYLNLEEILKSDGYAATAELAAASAKASAIAAALSETNAHASEIAAAKSAADTAAAVLQSIAARDAAQAFSIDGLGYLELVQAAGIRIAADKQRVEELAQQMAEQSAQYRLTTLGWNGTEGSVTVIDDRSPFLGLPLPNSGNKIQNDVGRIRESLTQLDSQFSGLANAAGDPAKGAALVGYDGEALTTLLNKSKKLADYAALRNYKGNADVIRVTQSGISGWFTKRAKQEGDVDNGGTRIVSTVGNFTYERDWSFMEADASWFGVVAGNKDNTVPLQLALSSGIKGIKLSTGTTRITDTISYKTNGQYLFGGGQSVTVLVVETGTKDGIVIDGFAGCRLLDMKITGSGNTDGVLVGVRNSQLFRGMGLRLENGWNGIEFNKVNNCKMSMGVIADLRGNYGVRFGGDITFKSDVLNLESMEFSHFNNNTIDAILWESYAHSLTMDDCRIIKGGRAIRARNSAGLQTGEARPSFLQMNVCEFDFTNKQGILLECMRDAWLNNIYAHGSVTESNIEFGEDTFTILCSNIRSNSAAKHGIDSAGDGVVMSNVKCLSNSAMTAATYNGINIRSQSSVVTLLGCQSGTGGNASQAYGLFIADGASDVTHMACNFSGNATGNIRQAADTRYTTGGSYRHTFENGMGVHLQIGGSTANLVNYLRAIGAAAGANLKIIAEGTDNNISIELSPKGTGTLMATGLSGKNFASDTAAAAGGIPVDGLYHTDGTVKVRRT